MVTHELSKIFLLGTCPIIKVQTCEANKNLLCQPVDELRYNAD